MCARLPNTARCKWANSWWRCCQLVCVVHLLLFFRDVRGTRAHVDQHKKRLLGKHAFLSVFKINNRALIFLCAQGIFPTSLGIYHVTWVISPVDSFFFFFFSGFFLQYFLGDSRLVREMLEFKSSVGFPLQLGMLYGREYHWNVFYDFIRVRGSYSGRV